MEVISEIEIDLTALIRTDFCDFETVDLRNKLPVWLQYRARRIPRRQRAVRLSGKVGAKLKNYRKIELIKCRFENGGDVSPWLSTSLERKKQNTKQDDLFQHWQISHFHLGELNTDMTQAERTRDLLFAFIGADEVVFLDILPHGHWTDTELLRTLRQTAPIIMNRFRCESVSTSQQLSPREITNLRRNCANHLIKIEGDLYWPPGGGVTASGVGFRFIKLADEITLSHDKYFKALKNPKAKLHFDGNVLSSLQTPIRLGVKFRYGEFILYDKTNLLEFYQSNPLR